MKSFPYAILVAALLLPIGAFAQDHGKKGEIENTVAIMSDDVIQARMKALGYTNVRLQKTQELQYHVDAVKDGQPVYLDFHPQLGTVRTFKTPAERLSAVRLMPVRPIATQQPH
jgi:hypothetical protein